MADPGAPLPPRDTSLPLGDLVVVMAHDLKNALAALSANLHFLEGSVAESADADSIEALGDSVTLCHVLDHLLRNLDLVGRTEHLAIRRDLTSLRSVATDALGRFQRQAKAAGIELSINAPTDRDALAFVDRDLFTRATENLVSSAIEHAPRGSRVVLEVASGDGESSIAVVDARHTPPPGLLEAALSAKVPGHASSDGQKGRGLSIYCADIAGRTAGGRLEQSARPGECRLRLVAPTRQ